MVSGLFSWSGGLRDRVMRLSHLARRQTGGGGGAASAVMYDASAKELSHLIGTRLAHHVGGHKSLASVALTEVEAVLVTVSVHLYRVFAQWNNLLSCRPPK